MYRSTRPERRSPSLHTAAERQPISEEYASSLSDSCTLSGVQVGVENGVSLPGIWPNLNGILLISITYSW